MMKVIILIAFAFLLVLNVSAQTLKVGSSVKNIEVTDGNKDIKTLHSLGVKPTIVYYIDPDAAYVNDPMASTLKTKNLPKDKYAEIAIVNAKDTWIPTSTIRTGARKNSKPGGLQVLIDEDKKLPAAWGLGDCNGACVVLLIGKDKTVKFIRYIKSKEESKQATGAFLSAVNTELSKN